MLIQVKSPLRQLSGSTWPYQKLFIARMNPRQRFRHAIAQAWGKTPPQAIHNHGVALLALVALVHLTRSVWLGGHHKRHSGSQMGQLASIGDIGLGGIDALARGAKVVSNLG